MPYAVSSPARARLSLLVVGAVVAVGVPAPASAAVHTVVADATSRPQASACRPSSLVLLVGGRRHCRVTLRFRLGALPGRVSAASLRLRARDRGRGSISIWDGSRRLGVMRKSGTLDVRRAVRGSRLTLTLRGEPRRPLKLARRGRERPVLVVRTFVPSASAGIWVTAAELARRPTEGPAWERLLEAADGAAEPANIADQDSDHDVDTLAAALVYARNGDGAYRAKVAGRVLAAIGTERGGRTLALARNLASYVVAADLIDLRGYDAAGEARFASWLDAVRAETLDGKTLISTHEVRPNNWGTMAGASRIAAALYLGDREDLDRAAAVFAAYVGDADAHAGFRFKDTSWQADPARPVGINPPNALRDGVDLDGAIPDDLRRGCSFAPVPCHTGYPWEALQGVVVQAELLSRHGYAAYSWGQEAIARAAAYLERLDRRFGGWWATGDDTWLPFVLNRAYGNRWPLPDRARPGKILGWTDWVYGP